MEDAGDGHIDADWSVISCVMSDALPAAEAEAAPEVEGDGVELDDEWMRGSVEYMDDAGVVDRDACCWTHCFNSIHC